MKQTVLLSLLLLLGTPLSTFAEDAAESFRCDGLLDTQVARAARAHVAGIFAADDADPGENVVAYFGASPAEVIELLNTGRITPAKGSLAPYVVAENPAVADHEAQFPERDLGRAAASLQLKMAVDQAWSRTVADVLDQRRARGKVNVDRYLSFLDNLKNEMKPGERVSPTFRMIVTATDESRLPIGTSVTNPRLRTLVRLHDIAWRTPANSTSTTGRAVLELLTDLPGRAGVTLALGRSIMSKLRWDDGAFPKLLEIELDDVVGIDPNTDAGFEFLNGLDRAPITRAGALEHQ